MPITSISCIMLDYCFILISLYSWASEILLISWYLLMISFFSVLKLSLHKSFISLINIIAIFWGYFVWNCFIYFLISLSFVNMKATPLCINFFHPTTLLNVSLSIRKSYIIIPSTNKKWKSRHLHLVCDFSGNDLSFSLFRKKFPWDFLNTIYFTDIHVLYFYVF